MPPAQRIWPCCPSVPDWVLDEWNKRYRCVGLAPRRPNGTFDVELLRPGEWIVEPGLVYASAEGSLPT